MRIGICPFSHVPGRVVVALRAGRLGRAGARSRPSGGGAGLAEQLLDLRSQRELAALGQAVNELGHEGVQALVADAADGLPHNLGGRGDGTVGARGGRRSSRCFSARVAR